MSNTQSNPVLITASVREGEEEEFNAIEAIVSKFGPDSLEKYRRRKVEATYGNLYVEKKDVESNMELEVTTVNDGKIAGYDETESNMNPNPNLIRQGVLEGVSSIKPNGNTAVPSRLKWSDDEEQTQKIDEENLGFGGNKKLGFGGGNKDDIAEKGSGTTNVEGEGKPVIHVQSEQFIHLKEKNSKLVVGSFIGRRPGYAYVKDVVTRMWRLKNPFVMRAYGDRMFTFEFEKEEDRSSVLEMGSFHVASQLVVIRPWKLFVETESEELTTIPIWVLFKQFPMDLWDSKGFSMVGSAGDNCGSRQAKSVFGHHDKTCPKKKQNKVEQSVWVEKEKPEDDSGSVVGDDQCGKDDLQLVVVDEDHVVEKSNEGVRGSEGEKSEECTQNPNQFEPNKTPPMSEQPYEEESEKGKQKVSEEGTWETPKKKHTFRPSSPSRNTTNYESIQKRVGEKLAKLKGSNNEGGYGHPQSVQKRSGMTSGGGYGSLQK
ncbi:hypothetical protein FRX31_028771, partial [Thalictrum thalictroides]